MGNMYKMATRMAMARITVTVNFKSSCTTEKIHQVPMRVVLATLPDPPAVG